MEQAVAARSMPSGENGGPLPPLDSEKLQTWLQDFSAKLQQQVWSALEVHMEEVVARAVNKATQELQAAVGVAAAAPHQASAAEHEAASKIQATARAHQEQARYQKQRSGAICLQAHHRARQVRKQLGGGALSRDDLLAKHDEWKWVFDDGIRRGGCDSAAGLSRAMFEEVLREVHARVSKEQAGALWAGITKGMGKAGVDSFAFCKLCEALSLGDSEAAEFADMTVEAYLAAGEADTCHVAGEQGVDLDEDDAATRLQAHVRGRQRRKTLERQEIMATKLQRAIRLWLARDKRTIVRVASAARRLKSKHGQRFDIFMQYAKGQEQLGAEVFCTAIIEAEPRLSHQQAMALWTGCCAGMHATGIDIFAFCNIAQACAVGDRTASEYADLSPDKFIVLGTAQGGAGTSGVNGSTGA